MTPSLSLEPTLLDVLGNRAAKHALLLLAIDPGLGGVLLVGPRGTGKSTLARAARTLFAPIDTVEGCALHLSRDEHENCPLCTGPARTAGTVRSVPSPFIRFPLNTTEERVSGGIDLESTVTCGVRRFQVGLVGLAHRGALVIDDLELLPQEIWAQVRSIHESGWNRVFREGLVLSHPARFVLIATASSDENGLTGHTLDRFGLCARVEGIETLHDRRRILVREASEEVRWRKRAQALTSRLTRTVERARARLPRIELSDEALQRVVDRAVSSGCAGHRGEIHLARAAKAWAALQGESKVRTEHVDRVAFLVLGHRARTASPDVDPPSERDSVSSQQQPAHDSRTDESRPDQSGVPEEPANGSGDHKGQERGENQERTFSPETPYRVRPIRFARDRITRRASGRRTRTRTSGRSGRSVGIRTRIDSNDVALDATLRAAAPWQVHRGREPGGRVEVRMEDLRHRRRERRMGHLVVFCVDASGSMGVKRRMAASKTAILSLLHDCYQRRDKVALVAFRKDRADVLLPPTSSIALAHRRLKDLPTGGRTPLASALMVTRRLILEAARRHPKIRPVLVMTTDGRATVGSGGRPLLEEVDLCARWLASTPGLDSLVIDTEPKGNALKTDRARRLASSLGARYVCVDDLEAADLVRWVRGAMEGVR